MMMIVTKYVYHNLFVITGKVTQMDEMPLATTNGFGDNKDYKLMSYVGSESSLIHPSLAPTIRFDRSPSPDEG